MSDSTDDASGLARVTELIAAGTLTGPVVHDSRAVTAGCLFACLRGEHSDGHKFAARALADGAVVVLVDHLLDGLDPSTQLVVDDTRRRLGPIAAMVAGNPSDRLTAVGITGTNGKTTTAHLLAAILEAAGHPTGVVGTLHGTRTTPEAPELQQLLSGFVERGDTAAVLEVSSHALALHRVDGTHFDAVVFTNLGHDHLDLHGSLEAYFRAKAALFAAQFAPIGVVNVDDIHGRLIADAAGGTDFRVVPFSVGDLTDVDVTTTSHRYTWRDTRFDVPLGGEFNVSNSLAALATAEVLGVDIGVAAVALASVSPVAGRFEVVDSPPAIERGITVVVDYAHTPDGLETVLRSARRALGDGDVIVVFGCGGDRDREKRPEMGAVAARCADRVVVTSDNPRHESPMSIIDDIIGGISGADREHVAAIADRREAIGHALDTAHRGDIVVIAGKGHERTQDFADRVVDFDDRVVARKHLEDAT